MTTEQPTTEWLDAYALQLERRIAAALVHIDRARAYATDGARTELAAALDVLRGEATP